MTEGIESALMALQGLHYNVTGCIFFLQTEIVLILKPTIEELETEAVCLIRDRFDGEGEEGGQEESGDEGEEESGDEGEGTRLQLTGGSREDREELEAEKIQLERDREELKQEREVVSKEVELVLKVRKALRSEKEELNERTVLKMEREMLKREKEELRLEKEELEEGKIELKKQMEAFLLEKMQF
ncbi:uncharacterized protein LOC131228826 [Magnolia sinica]|uniref:uncharacterized protein LOC131228826 n=1 Tax=Magnolia sinica TaxID=86752 RepID=UPI00265A2854|nr:uncharacterized protein LOC131228826 [Magnolia sinica]